MPGSLVKVNYCVFFFFVYSIPVCFKVCAWSEMIGFSVTFVSFFYVGFVRYFFIHKRLARERYLLTRRVILWKRIKERVKSVIYRLSTSAIYSGPGAVDPLTILPSDMRTFYRLIHILCEQINVHILAMYLSVSIAVQLL